MGWSRRRVLVLALLLGTIGALPAAAQTLSTFETLTISTAAAGITSTVTNPTGGAQMNSCALMSEDNAFRIRIDGTAPTSSVGVPIAADVTVWLFDNASARAARLIRSGASDATISVWCVSQAVEPGRVGMSVVNGGGSTTAATNTELDEDAAAADGQTGNVVLQVRTDTMAVSSGADGDATFFQSDDSGRTRVSSCIDADADGECDSLDTVIQTPYFSADLDETAEEVDDGAGSFCSIYVSMSDATALWVQVFLDDSDNVTVGTTTPDAAYLVPANPTAALGVAGNILPANTCFSYTNGLTIAATTTSTGNTGPGAAGDLQVVVGTK